MKRNQFHSEEVVSRWNARRHREGVLSVVIKQFIYGPFSIGTKSLFPNLEPLEVGRIGLQGTVYFGKVCHDWTQVARSDRVIAIVSICTIPAVMPFCSDLGSGWYIHNRGRVGSDKWIVTSIARHVNGGNIGDWSIVRGHADASVMALVYTVDVELLKDCVAIS